MTSQRLLWVRAPLVALLAALVIPVMADHAPEHTASSSVISIPRDALQALGLSVRGAANESEFLDPEVAYVLSTQLRDAQTIVVRWDIEEGYYLYRDKFHFDLKDPTVAGLGAIQLPKGKIKEDPYFGRQEVYYHQVEAVIPVRRGALKPLEIVLNVGYQGCADAGLCYPPITKTVSLMLPAAAAKDDPDSPTMISEIGNTRSIPLAATLAEQDRIARTLADGVGWLLLATFFGFGLLLTFTPCVFPMIPILSSIIVGQGEQLGTRRAFTLSLTYVLAMSLAYTAAGVAAGLLGASGNLQAAFQNPWILSAFIALFVLLALSMFGFYDLQIPASWQTRLARLSNRQSGGTYIGAGVMGILSALIVGPCVAAPLAGALIYIGQTGDAVLGGTALFALSLGMGTPVLIIGTSSGRLLPKVGPWMKAMKALSGVALLGIAIYLLERIAPESITMLLWAALLVGSGVYLGTLGGLVPGANGWRRLWKGTGLAMALYGCLLIVGVATGGRNLLRPLDGLAGGDSIKETTLSFRAIKGLSGLHTQVRNAAAQGKPVMLDFYADWCVSCKELERDTFSDPQVQAALSDAILLRADVTANDTEDQELLKALGLFGPPALLFFGRDGNEHKELRIVGFIAAAPFETHVRRAMNGG
jgi:thiol:disulfide interchange protein DsbD